MMLEGEVSGVLQKIGLLRTGNMSGEERRAFTCMIPFTITNAESAIEFELRKMLTDKFYSTEYFKMLQDDEKAFKG